MRPFWSPDWSGLTQKTIGRPREMSLTTDAAGRQLERFAQGVFNQWRAMSPAVEFDNATEIAWDCASASLAVEKWALVHKSEESFEVLAAPYNKFITTDNDKLCRRARKQWLEREQHDFVHALDLIGKPDRSQWREGRSLLRQICLLELDQLPALSPFEDSFRRECWDKGSMLHYYRQLNEGTAIEATNRPLRSAESDSEHDKRELVLQLYALTATGRMLAETIYALQELVSSLKLIPLPTSDAH
ncbi:hypothetical protein JCM3766R1_002699 [Sporobolomyces carnicolor]